MTQRTEQAPSLVTTSADAEAQSFDENCDTKGPEEANAALDFQPLAGNTPIMNELLKVMAELLALMGDVAESLQDMKCGRCRAKKRCIDSPTSSGEDADVGRYLSGESNVDAQKVWKGPRASSSEGRNTK